MTGVWVGFDQPKTIIANGYAAELAVPIWAAFMKRATKGDKPEWLDKPDNVVTVKRLPDVGQAAQRRLRLACRWSPRTAQLETRSMIYTEYFVKGTQPTTVCPLHESPSLLDRLAGVFGKDGQIAAGAGRRDRVCQLPPAASTSGNASAFARHDEPRRAPRRGEETRVDEPKKKRGFWSRVFGGGADKKDEDKKKAD